MKDILAFAIGVVATILLFFLGCAIVIAAFAYTARFIIWVGS